MTKAEKTAVIEGLKEKFGDSNFFYVTDASELTVETTSQLRRLCFEKGIEIKVLKNTLVRKALESFPEEKNYAGLMDALKGPTAIMFTETANAPAKLIKEFRKDNEKPVLKAAYIDQDVFFGDDQIEALANLKSKEELIGEVITLLQSPAKNVISALKSSGSTIAGIIKTLSEREG